MLVERESLIADNQRLVTAVAQQVVQGLATPAPMEDLVEYGMVGLVEAADRYDPTRGVPFSSFAWPRIRGAVIDGLRKLRGLSRMELNRLRFQRAAAAILSDAAAEPDAQTYPVEEEYARTADLVADVGVTYIVSCEAQGIDPPDPRPSTERLVADREIKDQLAAVLERLPDRQRRLLQMHYFGDLTLEQAGRELGINRVWAWRLHNRAIGSLREELSGSA